MNFLVKIIKKNHECHQICSKPTETFVNCKSGVKINNGISHIILFTLDIDVLLYKE